MASLTELLENRTQYPDATKITLADGVETTFGDLRSGYMKDADYRKKTSEVAEQRRALNTERQSFMEARAEAQAQLEALAEKVVKRDPTIQKTELDEELESNPLAKKLMERIAKAEERAADADKKAAQIEAGLRQREEAAMVEAHRQVARALKEKDPDLDEEKLFDYAKTHYIPRLDLAYELMTKSTREAKIAEEAKQKGIEEGRRIAAQPRIPERRTVSAPSDANAPQSFDEAMDAALQDPEILANFHEGQAVV